MIEEHRKQIQMGINRAGTATISHAATPRFQIGRIERGVRNCSFARAQRILCDRSHRPRRFARPMRRMRKDELSSKVGIQPLELFELLDH